MPRSTHKISAELWGAEAIAYDAAAGKITFPRKMSGQQETVFVKIENLSTKAVLYSRGTAGLGGTFNKTKSGNWELTLEYDGVLAGDNHSVLKTELDVPSSMLSKAQLVAQEANLQVEQTLTLAEVSANTSISVGQYGFKVISDTGSYSGPFSAIMSMMNGTYLSPATTTLYGSSNLSYYELTAGVVIPGAWNTIVLNSGAVLGYYSMQQPSNIV